MSKKLFDPKDGEFAKNIRSTIDDDLTELRESMKAHQWIREFPALIDENGVVLVGHRRLKVAKELGIAPVKKILNIGKGDAADAERLKLAFASNIGGRPMDLKDRRHMAEVLYNRGWIMERIAATLGVNHATISRDLEGLCTVHKPDRPKGGRPKSTHKPKSPDKVAAEAVAAKLVLDHGKTLEQAATETGLRSVQGVKISIAKETTRREIKAEPDVERSDLPLTLQQKFDAAIKKYDREFEVRLRLAVNQEVERWGEAILPTLKKELDDARAIDEALRSKGIMDRNTYNSIRRCLHPDSRLSLSDEILAKAFDKFKELERYLLSAKDAPGSFTELPENFEEWSKMRRKGTAGRKTKGKNSVVRR